MAVVPVLRSQASAGPLRAGSELDELDEQLSELDVQTACAVCVWAFQGPGRPPPIPYLKLEGCRERDRGTGQRGRSRSASIGVCGARRAPGAQRAKNTRQRMRKEAQEMLAQEPWAKAQYWAHRVHTPTIGPAPGPLR